MRVCPKSLLFFCYGGLLHPVELWTRLSSSEASPDEKTHRDHISTARKPRDSVQLHKLPAEEFSLPSTYRVKAVHLVV